MWHSLNFILIATADHVQTIWIIHYSWTTLTWEWFQWWYSIYKPLGTAVQYLAILTAIMGGLATCCWVSSRGQACCCQWWRAGLLVSQCRFVVESVTVHGLLLNQQPQKGSRDEFGRYSQNLVCTSASEVWMANRVGPGGHPSGR